MVDAGEMVSEEEVGRDVDGGRAHEGVSGVDESLALERGLVGEGVQDAAFGEVDVGHVVLRNDGPAASAEVEIGSELC